MAKIKTTVTLNTLSTTHDQQNWIDGEEYDFEIEIEEQEGGKEATVALPSKSGLTFTFSEIEALYKQMSIVERSIEN